MSLYTRLFTHQGGSAISIPAFIAAVNAVGTDVVTEAERTSVFSLTTPEENEAAEFTNCLFGDPTTTTTAAATDALWLGYSELKTEAEVKLLLDPTHIYIPA